MTMVETEEVVAQPLSAAAAKLDPSAPVRVQGKFFFVGDKKHFVKGVTYGPFPKGSHGAQFPEYAVVDTDFALMAEAGINTVRVFTVPPLWLLDAAEEAGLKVLVGLPWSQHVAFLDDKTVQAGIRDAIVAGVRSSCTYAGARDLPSFAERAVIGVQSASGYTEGMPVPTSW